MEVDFRMIFSKCLRSSIESQYQNTNDCIWTLFLDYDDKNRRKQISNQKQLHQIFYNTMGAQLCNDALKLQPGQFQNCSEQNGFKLLRDRQNQQKEPIQRVEVSSFPTVNKHVQQKISKMTKIQPSSAKLWRIPSMNLVYACSDPLNNDFPPKGRVQVYKTKESGQFQGYFEGEIEQKYKPVLAKSFFVYSNASYFEGRGEKEGLKYEGQWENQQPSGMGKQVSNKGIYEGNYLNGKKHGKGHFKWNSGLQYQGQFKQGHPHGNGQIIDSTQAYQYKGQFQLGLAHGQGKQTSKKQVYEGQFIKGKRCGVGRLILKNEQGHQTEYQGQFLDGLPSGPGRYLKNGQQITGIWLEGKMISIDSI